MTGPWRFFVIYVACVAALFALAGLLAVYNAVRGRIR